MPGDPETKEYVTSLRVCNSLSIALTFALEPWGEQYKLAPEETFEIVARGPEGTPSKWNLPMTRSSCTDGQARSLPCFIREQS